MAQNPNSRAKTGDKAEEHMTARTQGWEARTLTASGHYVLGQDAQLRDARSGLVLGPWSDAVKYAARLRRS